MSILEKWNSYMDNQPQETPEEKARREAIAAEWEEHSQWCEWIEANVPAAERHEAFAKLDQEFKARGVITPVLYPG
jgi:hypothetical protein